MEQIPETITALDQLAERRAERRGRVFKGAVLRFNKGYSAMEAVARNLTARGAMLVFGDTSGVPSHFEIELSGDDTSRAAKVVWRSERNVGIAFV